MPPEPDSGRASVVMKINLDEIQSRLFEKDMVRKKILRDFGISQEPIDPKDFVRLVVDALNQPVVFQPLDQWIANSDVFRAAVWALGSNSRNWCHFLRNEKQIKDILEGYDPVAAALSFDKHPDILSRIESNLVGQTSRRDAESMRKWAHLLSKEMAFYKEITRVGNRFRNSHNTLYGETLDDFDLALCIVGHFADESCSGLFKFPGMRYILASEFLKNLGWSCFKPDRHVNRLFNIWFADQKTSLINQNKLVSLESVIRMAEDLQIFGLFWATRCWAKLSHPMAVFSRKWIIWFGYWENM
jgi:hypothetical protein